MPLSDFLPHASCPVDDPYRDPVRRPLRSRGPRTTALTGPEVITVERVGEFLGLDHDGGLLAPSRRYHAAELPALARIHRTTFARPAANPYAVKRQIHAHLASELAAGEPAWLVGGPPVEACRLARAKYCHRLKGDAAFGYDPAARDATYGFRPHARCTPAGAIVAFDLAPANVSGVAMVDQLAPPPGSVGVGDRGYWSPPARNALAAAGVARLAPFKNRSKGPDPRRSRRLSRARWAVETVFGQLAGRFRAERTWARDLWHLSHRVIRKGLGHTVAVWINRALGRRLLDFDGLAAG